MRAFLCVCLYALLGGLLGCLISCGGKDGGASVSGKGSIFEGMDRRSRLRLQSYMAAGQRLYNRHCVNCHQRDGRGLRQLIPPLRQADWLKRPAAVACIIRYGMRTPIWVNGRRYQAVMPPNEQLRDIEVAEIMSYIGNAWGNRAGLFPVREVRTYLKAAPCVDSLAAVAGRKP